MYLFQLSTQLSMPLFCHVLFLKAQPISQRQGVHIKTSTNVTLHPLILPSQIQSYMVAEQVPEQVQKKVLEYFDLTWERHLGVDENIIFSEYLPPVYRKEVGI